LLLTLILPLLIPEKEAKLVEGGTKSYNRKGICKNSENKKYYK
jgi:hypothetical protein